jgi:hypothetical protein
VILGRITDASGEPVAHVEMEALVRRNTITNRRSGPAQQTATVQGVWTDDRGAYRLFGLPPGSYYVKASDSGFRGITRLPYGSSFDPVTTEGHPPIYFPGVSRLQEAQKITVHAGEEVRIDFSLDAQKTYSISGQVRGVDGKPVVLREVTISAYQSRPETGFSSVMSELWTNEQGGFEFKTVAPGSYLVWIMTRDEDNQYWAGQHIEVADRNISGLQLQMLPGTEVSGRVEAAEALKPDLQQTRISLRADGLAEYTDSEDADVQNDGTFKFASLSRTRHSFEVRGLPDGWYLRKATFDNQDLLVDGLNLAGETNHALVVTISIGAARIKGIVLDGDRPVRGAMVRLVPSSLRLQIMDAWTGQDGRFAMANVPPGEYRVLAAPLESDSLREDNDFEAMSIVLAENESKTIEINLDKTPK